MELGKLLEICEFADFPFNLKPTASEKVWAGMPAILKELQEFRYNVEVNHLSEFGILSGQPGTGKSHSLLHLRHLVTTKPLAGKCLAIYIDNPTGIGSKGTFLEDYAYVVSNSLGKETVKRVFAHALNVANLIVAENTLELTPSEQVAINRNPGKQDELAAAVYRDRVKESPVTYKISKQLAEGKADAWEWLVGGGTTVAEEEVQPLTSHILAAKALATIVKLATWAHGDEKLFNAVFMLLDQTEDLVPLKPGLFQEQIVGWRTLVDEIDSSFGMLWAMNGNAEDIVANFTDAIEGRLTVDTERLSLLPLEAPEAKEFLIGVMKIFRKDGASVPKDIYPFSDDGLDEVIVSTPVKIPRKLLITCRNIFTQAAKRDTIKSKKDLLNQAAVRTLYSGSEESGEPEEG